MGATFKITHKLGDVLGEYTTDANGLIQVDNLVSGWYTATEVSAPVGYKLFTGTQDFQVTNTKTVTLEFPNQKLTSLIIKKVDEKSNAPLSGAKFTVEKQNGEHVGEFTTDSDGTINIPTLTPDFYIVREKQAPSGYLLDESSKTVEIKTDVPTLVTFTNKKLTALQIIKVDEKTGVQLGGAKFTVESQKGELIGTYTTDAQGYINIPELAPNFYTVKETKAPDGYLLDESPKTVEIKTDIPTVITFTNKKLTSLQIKKIDEISGKALAGAVFEIEKQNGEKVTTGENGTEFTTDAQGFINVPTLAPDHYIVREIKAPEGYILDKTPKTVEVKTDSPTVVTFTNKYLSGLQIVKVDAESGVPLPLAKFTVYKKSGDIVGDYVTDKNGVIIIDQLENGWYKIAETKAPDGYKIEETPKDIEIKGNQFLKIVFTNSKLSGIVIKKVSDKDGSPLSGAKFVVEKQNGELIGEYTTDKDGTINVPTLQPDYYIVREKQAPTGFILDETPKTVQVKTDVPTVVTFVNKVKSGFQIIKIDAKTGSPLPGAKFTVYKKSGEVIGEFTTDNNGVIILDNLDNGWYKIAETKAPDGYMISESPKDVELTGNQFLRIVFENKKLTSLQIKKIDEISGKALVGAVFEIEKQNGEKITTNENGTEFTTDAQGFINVPTLAPDHYIVREVKAPEGYILDKTPKTVEVKTDSPTVVVFTNKYLSGLQIIKVDAKTNEPLAGAKFTVYKKSGDVIGEFTTDANGVIILDQLENGWYKLAETKAPEGYVISEEPKDIEIKGNNFHKIVFKNEKMSSLIIKKVDSIDKKVLDGAKFEVVKVNGEKIGEFTTDKSGLVNVPNLKPDFYIIKEIKAPDGYALNSTPQTIEMKTDKPLEVVFENTPLAGLQIKKINSETRNPIEGVEFMITKANGEKVGNFKTDKQGMIFVNNLDVGSYIVTETKAAAGYLDSKEPKFVEITSKGKPILLEIENKPVSSLLIFKTDMMTGKPLGGVVFDIKRADGQRIQGSILDENMPQTANNSPNKSTTLNGDISGSYTTDANGRILINYLAPGEYHVIETKQLPGYELDTEVHTVTIVAGKQGVVKVQNKALSGLKILKIDSITKAPIFNVEFMVFDSNGKVVGTFYTDNMGVIDFAAILSQYQF